MQLCDKINDLLSNLGQTPATFTGRILFMSMFNDISCDTKGNKDEWLANAGVVKVLARKFDVGQWSFIGPGSEKKWYSAENSPQGAWDNIAEQMLLEFAESGHPISARAPCRRRNGEAVPRAVNFGDLITADHKVLSDNCESRNNHRYAVVVQDLATQWIQAYPCKNKTSQETQRSLQKFLEPERKPKVIYTDNSLEFGKACEDLSWNHCTSTPHRSETKGIAERAVPRVKEGTSAVLLQSGLNESWWADSMECYTYLRNVTDLLSDGKTPYERRFGQPFKGPIIPFGSLVEYHPITAKDQSRIHQFGKKVLPGLFLGYALYAGGIWKGDVLIADFEDDGRIGNLLEKTQCERGDISQTRRIYFSNRRWTNQNTWRRSGPENIHSGTASTNSRRGSH